MSALLAINWEPQLRGILIIIISTVILCGSIYLILGTNIGARLGFLLSLSALAGWLVYAEGFSLLMVLGTALILVGNLLNLVRPPPLRPRG
jgi:hypothetical protein